MNQEEQQQWEKHIELCKELKKIIKGFRDNGSTLEATKKDLKEAAENEYLR